MNPNLAKLQPYPFERLRLLFKDITPDARYTPINLGIGEPKHPTPEFIRQALNRTFPDWRVIRRRPARPSCARRLLPGPDGATS